MKYKIEEYINSSNYQPKNYQELYDFLEVKPEEEKEFRNTLNRMLNNYDLVLSKKSRFILPKDANIYKGIISINNPDYGFITSDSFSEDLYVHKNGMNSAFNKDLVVFSLDDFYRSKYKNSSKQEARVIKVLERNLKTFVGELKRKANQYYLDVNNPQVKQIDIIDSLKCSVGDIVKVEIINYKKVPIQGNVIERIGYKNDVGVDILEIAAKYDFSNKFPDEVILEVDSRSDNIENEIKIRKKPSLENIFTMDGEDAKDLDDAVAIKKLDSGNFLLGVYIADVSYYVIEGSEVDLEAYSRGTSVYLTNVVLPMLPVRLSNDLCSLNPNTNKLVIALEMEIDKYGEVINSDLFPSYIATKYRMTYNNINLILDGNSEVTLEYKDIYSDILAMRELKDILTEARNKRGALDFDVPEAKIIIGEDGKVKDVEVIKRGIGERIIEEFMIKANEVVASRIYFLELPFIYRVHDEPNDLKLNSFKQLSNSLGYKKLKTKTNSKQLQDFLSSIEDEDSYLKTILLKSMAKAIYDVENIGHYGLASDCYTHFTSPIRRYPDLIVHRLIRKYLFNHEIDPSENVELYNKIKDIAEQSSAKERAAIECEYEVEDLKKAEYMENFVGEVFSGVISGVNRYGLFVQLANTVEGLVHISNIKGKYTYDSKTLSLTSTHGQKYRLGDKVLVEVLRADKQKREVDFKIIKEK